MVRFNEKSVCLLLIENDIMVHYKKIGHSTKSIGTVEKDYGGNIIEK